MATPGNKELKRSYRTDSGEKAWSAVQAPIPKTKAMIMWHLRRLPISKTTCACMCTQTRTYTCVGIHSPHASCLLVSRLVQLPLLENKGAYCLFILIYNLKYNDHFLGYSLGDPNFQVRKNNHALSAQETSFLNKVRLDLIIVQEIILFAL